MPDLATIHKIVYDLAVRPETGLVQSFEVPAEAALVAVDWDTRHEFGVALWYRFPMTTPQQDITWRVTVVGTGHPFDDSHGHLGTVVREGFAWHLLDADGDRIRAAGRGAK